MVRIAIHNLRLDWTIITNRGQFFYVYTCVQMYILDEIVIRCTNAECSQLLCTIFISNLRIYNRFTEQKYINLFEFFITYKFTDIGPKLLKSIISINR